VSRPALRLVTADLALTEAAVGDPPALARALDCELADGWDAFPGAMRRTRDALAADPGGARWGTRLFVLEDPSTLVGWGGFKGAPQAGAVEIGYAVAPAWQNRGIATAAVEALLGEAFAAPGVESVIAHTRPGPNPSTRVLEKTGFAYEADVIDLEAGTAWRFRQVKPLHDRVKVR
jgi:[ribosomal protein S5]-alanine N-acetyltransferase